MALETDLAIRRLCAPDAPALCAFYNGLSEASRRTFRPLGIHTTETACQAVCEANTAGTKCDLVVQRDNAIVAWGFVWNLDQPEPMFGLAVADALHRQGLGSALTQQVLAYCDSAALPRITLTVVTDNHRAKRIHERAGFRDYGQFHHVEDDLDYFRMERLRPISQ